MFQRRVYTTLLGYGRSLGSLAFLPPPPPAPLLLPPPPPSPPLLPPLPPPPSPPPPSTPFSSSLHSYQPLPVFTIPLILQRQIHVWSAKEKKRSREEVKEKDKELKKGGNGVNGDGDDEDVHKVLAYNVDIMSRSIYHDFVEEFRNAASDGKRVHGIRILPSDPKKKMLVLILRTELKGVRKEVKLKILRRNVYCEYVDPKGNVGWIKLESKGGSLSISYGNELEDIRFVGGIELQIAVQNFHSKGDHRSLMRIIIHTLEAARFPEIENLIGSTMEGDYTPVILSAELKRRIRNWGYASKKIVNGDEEGLEFTLAEASTKIALLNCQKDSQEKGDKK